jgi:hypothetical protein
MYTPPSSDFSVISLRRLAWTMDTTMGTAFGRIVQLMPTMMDSDFICQHYRNNTKCSSCVFKTTISDSEKVALTAI